MRRGYGTIIALALVLAACSSGPTADVINRNEPPPTTTTTTLPPEGVVVIEIANGTFKPALLKINIEEQWIVRWVNKDEREYVIFLRDAFESPPLQQGDTFEYDFRQLDLAIHRYYTFAGNQRIPGQVDSRPER